MLQLNGNKMAIQHKERAWLNTDMLQEGDFKFHNRQMFHSEDNREYSLSLHVCLFTAEKPTSTKK